MADVVFPAQAYTEREGTFTSGERRVQRFYPAVPARGEARADFAITAALGRAFGLSLGDIAARVMNNIVTAVAAFGPIGPNAYRRLAESAPQWPFSGRSDLYYGGTTDDNHQGLGVQLKPDASAHSLIVAKMSAEPRGPALPVGEMIAVPVTRLYDQGETVAPTSLLKDRIGEPWVAMHPDEAVRLRLRGGEGRFGPTLVSLNGADVTAAVVADENVPVGIVLVPRSFGLPINAPAPVSLKMAVRTAEKA